ncbi:PEP-CTERM sorting domain-containing protein [Parasulfuritortus cantonensis]|uniref:PEP-CTERM sorting domain-containing protein n=1 Tax=Parasulfuritortus cantonensis TaxID=2528202 RepID=A0A4R1B124_9PROT|nr:PEP-CTERM sorting domain-containing protein [Parasulfuritortus cantonensis]TCJ11702.1 PEP-CTERM sorting domain-containing protein [Parasulfuritortus cantonensis]
MKKTLILAAFAAALPFQAVEANAAVLDFDGLYHDDALVADAGYRYEEDGFRLVNAGDYPFATYGAQVSPEYTGSTALFNDNNNGVTVLTQIGGGAFDLTSIDLAELILGGSSYSVTFTGTTTGGAAVTQQFTLDGLAGSETFSFDSSFSNLTSVVWTNSPDYTQFDNITVAAAVPEPQTYAMMLAGLGLLGTLRRRTGKRA